MPAISNAPAIAADQQMLIIPAGEKHGVDSAPLQALATYHIVARGTIGYGAGDADAECTTGGGPLPLQWMRERYPFIFVNDPALLVASDFWDPDPTDDPGDLYVDHKNVEWIPVNPSIDGCDDSAHTYETWLTPIETRPVNFGVFDIAYNDNYGAFTVSIEQVAPAVPLPSVGMHTETVLVHAVDPAGSSTAPLAANHNYLFIAHGSYIFDTTNFGNVADTECSRTGTDSQYLRHRYGDDLLDVVVNGNPIEWHGLGPETPVPGAQGCSPAHAFWVIGPGHGVPITLSIADGNPTDNAGTLSIDVYRL